MPLSRLGFQYLAIAQEYMSGQVEAQALWNKNIKSIAKFLYKDIICQQEVFKQLSIDSGRENTNITIIFMELYNIKRAMASAYYLQAQGFIKRGHKPIVNTLAKIDGLQLNNLYTILQVDKMTVK